MTSKTSGWVVVEFEFPRLWLIKIAKRLSQGSCVLSLVLSSVLGNPRQPWHLAPKSGLLEWGNGLFLALLDPHFATKTSFVKAYE